MTLYFATPTPMELDYMLIHGLSAKDDPGAIGRFGTGFKYGIAGVLRLGGSIQVQTDGEIYSFSTEPITFRGKTAKRVVMTHDDKQSSLHFTTDLGAHWAAWQLFREFYSNTLDEGGITSINKPEKNYRSVIEINSPALEDIYHNRRNYIIQPEDKPLWTDGQCEVFDRSNNGAGLFNKRLRISDKNTILAYNNNSRMDLTEDRTASSPLWEINNIQDAMFRSCEDVKSLKILFLDTLSPAEKYMSLREIAFRPVLEKLFNELKSAPGINKARFNVLERIVTQNPNVGRKALNLNTLQERQLKRALEFLEDVGLPITYEIKVYESLGFHVHGRAKNQTIELSSLAFAKGTKWLAATILEEQIHLAHGYADETRGMQEHLFDLVITQSEKIKGEPL